VSRAVEDACMNGGSKYEQPIMRKGSDSEGIGGQTSS